MSIGIVFGPVDSFLEGREFGNDEAARETGLSRVLAVDRGIRTGCQQAAVIAKRLEAFEMIRTCSQAFFE
jgi:hypothetical protein